MTRTFSVDINSNMELHVSMTNFANLEVTLVTDRIFESATCFEGLVGVTKSIHPALELTLRAIMFNIHGTMLGFDVVHVGSSVTYSDKYCNEANRPSITLTLKP